MKKYIVAKYDDSEEKALTLKVMEAEDIDALCMKLEPEMEFEYEGQTPFDWMVDTRINVFDDRHLPWYAARELHSDGTVGDDELDMFDQS